MSTPGDGPRSRRWWRDNATLLAVLGLLVTMVFNTFGVWQQARESERSRKDTQIALFTQLSALVAEAESAVVEADVQPTVCRLDDTSETQDAAVYRAAEYYDYLALLFNNEEIELQSAKRHAAPAMLDLYDLAADTFDLGWVQTAYPELKRFKDDDANRKFARRHRDPCE